MYLSFGFGDNGSKPAGARAEERSAAEAEDCEQPDMSRREAQMAILTAVERGEMSPQEAMERLDELEE